MFVGFNLQGLDDKILSVYKGAGEANFNIQKKQVQKKLDCFVLDDGSLDGSALQDDWFPEIKADIFLSHSHGDRKLIMAFAAMLEDKFGLTSFIDSCVWGYADELLKKIDDKYCKNETGDTYNYNQRNFSTSHVHMMLSSALTKMMDKAECLIFVNTPNSITTRDAVEDKTKSPWIYNEIVISQMLRKKKLVRSEEIKKSREFEASRNKLNIVYDADLDHLTPLSTDDLLDWEKKYSENRILFAFRNQPNHYPLDSLYEIKDLLKFKTYHK
ncbi:MULTISPECIES: hypothetical protein [Exiguobacterium]|uniref:hypothetical protein n=1 Tax=Exiguobacterium TaxID=33986 RepID=UPI0004792103|nr:MULTISPECIES: hypothetical protein [Exiguobacterium]MCT4780659.1 hypothetical protein [Exiguobacterium soli]